MKAKTKKALEERLDIESGDFKVPKLSPLKVNLHIKSNFNSFVRRRSSQVRKLLTDKPTTAIAILRHVWDQLYKDPKMRVLMNKYWKRNDEGSLAKLMLDMGKYKSQKDDKKLSATVNMIKKKYNTLRQACQLMDISWTHFHRHTYVKSKPRRELEYTRKLTSSNIQDIQNHYNSDDISFPLPDKKYANKRFMRTSILKSSKMYNLLSSTTRKISTATYYKYKPKAVKLQDHIPFRQSCCERCQNFENVNEQASKYMHNIPHNIGDCIDRSLCTYTGYFLNLQCILQKCDNCGIEKYKA